MRRGSGANGVTFNLPRHHFKYGSLACEPEFRECSFPVSRLVPSLLFECSLVLNCLLVFGCDNRGDSRAHERSTPVEVKKPQEIEADEKVEPTKVVPKETVPFASCPPNMNEIPGGTFWVGTEREVFDREENPRFQTKVAPFCAARFEVLTSEFESCVAASKCDAPRGTMFTCNSTEKGRGDHPINCIDHKQAVAVCEFQGGRLPTEVEWEYLARGGAEMRSYSWGEEHPDGRTCWKSNGSCKAGSFAEGAFGLHDVVGNVWEWTDSWFGPYPWPQADGRHKVYKGGSWSRRFEKWMRPTLRNRLDRSLLCPRGRSREALGSTHQFVGAPRARLYASARSWPCFRHARNADAPC